LYISKVIGRLAAGLLLLGITSYAALSIYKAISYTSIPPQPPLTETPTKLGLSYEEVNFVTAADDRLKLQGWWIPNPSSGRVLILVHGRNGNRASFGQIFRPLWERGFSLLVFDLRGHGQSDPAYCTWGLKEQGDLGGAVNFVKGKGLQAGAIGVIGWSIGAATALMAMSQYPDIKAVVSDSAYANAEPLLAHNLLYPGLVLALRFVRDIDIDQISPEKAIAHLGQRHVFLIQGEQDRQIPTEQFYRLQKAGRASVTSSWLVAGADHVQALSQQPDEYLRRVATFFDQELAST